MRETHDSARRVYRFLLLPSFHEPEIYRAELDGDRAFVLYKRLSGAGGYDPGEIEVEREIAVSPSFGTTLESMLEDAFFWSLTTHAMEFRYRAAVSEADCSRRMSVEMDGTMLVVEGATSKRWHAVDKDYPEDAISRVWDFLKSLDVKSRSRRITIP